MKKHLNIFVYFLLLAFCYIPIHSNGQVNIKGTVYDISQRIPLDGVSVYGTKGKATITDSFGHYNITLYEYDSICFSYLGKATKKIAVKNIQYPWAFDMSLHITTQLLPTVFVRPKSYKLDSLQNRLDYAKVFGFNKPNALSTTNAGNGAVGFDIDEIINAFNFKRTRRILAFQKRLVEQEQDRYINYRFNKGIIKKLTLLDGEQLETFMKQYRPSYYFIKQQNDLELYQYIWNAAKSFISHQ